MPENIILASSSPFRKALLANAGITFAAVRADIDERAAEAPLKGSGATPEDVALVLAVDKAAEVSERRPGALVVGCDQTLSLGDKFSKRRYGGCRRCSGCRGRPAQQRCALVAAAKRCGRMSLSPGDDAGARAGVHWPHGARRRGRCRASPIDRRRGIRLFERSRATISPSWLPLQLLALRELRAIDG